jgi:hypothetical protein
MFSIFLDVLLAIGTVVSASILTWRGLHPPKSKRDSSRNGLIYASFIVAFCCTVLQAYRNSQTSAQVDKLVNTDITFTHEIVIGVRDGAGIQTIVMNSHAAPQKNPAFQLRFVSGIVLVRNFNGDNDPRPWNFFLKRVRDNSARLFPSDVPLQQDRLTSNDLQLTLQDLADIRDGRARIYVTDLAIWNNTSGSESKATSCRFLGSRFSPDGLHLDQKALMHVCPSSLDI